MFFGGFGGHGFAPSISIGYGCGFLAMGFRLLIFIGLIVLAVKLFKKYSDQPSDTMKLLDERFYLWKKTY